MSLPSQNASPKTIRSMEQFMREFFPKEYERRKAEGRCIRCGAKKSKGLRI